MPELAKFSNMLCNLQNMHGNSTTQVIFKVNNLDTKKIQLTHSPQNSREKLIHL